MKRKMQQFGSIQRSQFLSILAREPKLSSDKFLFSFFFLMRLRSGLLNFKTDQLDIIKTHWRHKLSIDADKLVSSYIIVRKVRNCTGCYALAINASLEMFHLLFHNFFYNIKKN